MIDRKHSPFPLDPETIPALVGRQFIISRYEEFVDATDLKPAQKSVFKSQFEHQAILIDRDFKVEEDARRLGDPRANVPYHSRWHLWQTVHDDINAGYVLAERGDVPLYLAVELPQNGLIHDWGYMGDLNEKYPTYADRIWIHVENSMGKAIRLKRDPSFPSFYTDEEKEMSIWGTVIATHATHFRDKETMERLLRSRDKILKGFADKFRGQHDYDYLLSAGQALADAAQFGDLGGQIAAPYYMYVLPGLRSELNASTPDGEPPRGDAHIGTTPEQMIKNGSGFVQFVIINGRVYQTAEKLFGPGNEYEKAWKKLIIPKEE